MEDPMNPFPRSIPKPDFDQSESQWRVLFTRKIPRSVLVCGILMTMGVVTMMGQRSNEKKVYPGDVKWSFDELGRASIWGSFTIKHVPSGGVESEGTGGACLVADLNERYHQPSGVPPDGCTNNADCNNDDELKAKKWSGYCDGSPGKPGKCWVRPSTDPPTNPILCNRSIDTGNLVDDNEGSLNSAGDMKIWTLGKPHKAPKQPYLVPDEYRGIKWRVVACLNKINPNTGHDEKGCGGMQVLGTPRQVP